MNRYKYRVYLKDRSFDVVFDCNTPSDGQMLLEAQYGCQVTWMGQP
jgi:hypothetical protein